MKLLQDIIGHINKTPFTGNIRDATEWGSAWDQLKERLDNLDKNILTNNELLFILERCEFTNEQVTHMKNLVEDAREKYNLPENEPIGFLDVTGNPIPIDKYFEKMEKNVKIGNNIATKCRFIMQMNGIEDLISQLEKPTDN